MQSGVIAVIGGVGIGTQGIDAAFASAKIKEEPGGFCLGGIRFGLGVSAVAFHTFAANSGVPCQTDGRQILITAGT